MSTTITEVRTDAFQELGTKIKTKQARFGVIGLGYVGLPLGLTLNQVGFDVTGIDIDTKRVDAIQSGKSYITDIGDAELQNAIAAKRFRATADLSVIGTLDAISICVPTPLRKTKDPDMTYKKDIGDARESPAIEVIKLLQGLGANVVYSDPFIAKLNVDGHMLESVPLNRETVSACDIAVITTDHTAFDYLDLVRNAPLVFDTRNATDGLRAKNLVRL